MTAHPNPQTTVVVITHNYGRYLATAVTSVVDQTRRPRILIMDDGSTDNTEEVVRTLTERYPSVKSHRSATARGLAATRNAAARMVETEWLIYLDADDWLDSRFVEHGEHWLERRPTCDVLTTDVTLVRDERQPVVARARVPRSWRGLLRGNTVMQTSFIRRAMILALDGYDGAFDYEDWEFWIRAVKAGYTIDRLPGAHVYYRQHGDNYGAKADRVRATQAVRDRHGARSRWEALWAWWTRSTSGPTGSHR